MRYLTNVFEELIKKRKKTTTTTTPHWTVPMIEHATEDLTIKNKQKPQKTGDKQALLESLRTGKV